MGSATTSFTLDNDDQLNSTSSTTGGFVNSYGYNANGEQTSRTLSGTAYTVAYDYDGELTSITQGSSVDSFQYDALGRRKNRTAGGTTTHYLYDGGSILLEQQGSTTTATYTYGIGLIRKDGETPLFDGLGSERSVTNSSQTVTGTINYEAFGQTVGTTGSSTDPYKFAATSGYRNDGDGGLVHVGARYYDAQVGRFTSRDTDLDQKPYLYCEHDPVNAVDPSGHNVFSDFIGGFVTFIGGYSMGSGAGTTVTKTVATVVTRRILGIAVATDTTAVTTTTITAGAALGPGLMIAGIAVMSIATYEWSDGQTQTPGTWQNNLSTGLGKWLYGHGWY